MTKHMKRLASPRRWTIPKKQATWVLKPDAGAHPSEMSLPLGIVLRDYLEVVDSAREAKRVLGTRNVLVDGKPTRSLKHAVGYMDVVSLPQTGEHHRVLLDERGRLTLNPIPEANARWKLLRVEDKTTVKGGRIQLNLHDGRNLVVKRERDDYATGDVLKLSVPDQEVLAHHALAEGNIAMVTGGSHAGALATVRSVEVTRNPKPNLVHLAKGEDEFTTIKPYVFVVGADAPEIKVPEVTVA